MNCLNSVAGSAVLTRLNTTLTGRPLISSGSFLTRPLREFVSFRLKFLSSTRRSVSLRPRRSRVALELLNFFEASLVKPSRKWKISKLHSMALIVTRSQNATSLTIPF